MFDAADLTFQLAMNRRLAWLPRLSVITHRRVLMWRALIALGALGADRRVRRQGVSLETRRIDVAGHAPITLRIIRPADAARGIMLDYHGGAWALGNAQMDDALNIAIAKACGLVTVSVDYRLADPRPIAAVQAECFAAGRWLLEQGASELAEGPVFVTGESAGGHLAVSTLIRLRDAGIALAPIAGALLHYGGYDLGGTPSALTAGKDTLVLDGPRLRESMERLTPGMTDAQRRDPALSPLHADLAGLPPALILTGDIDPLRDDSIRLAGRWRGAGGDAELVLLPDAPHGVIHMRGPYAAKVRRWGHDWINARAENWRAGA